MQSLQAQAQAIADRYIPPDVGRPSDIGDPEILKQFLEAIADGNYMETACHLVGLSKVTVHNWTKRGEAGEAPFDRFVNAVKAAEARAEAKMLANVRRASELPQYWAAGMTVLERRHPERWGKRQDDTNTPRVVVQIGVGRDDVRVGIALSPPNISDLACGNHSQVEMLSPIIGHYVNELEPAIESAPAQVNATVDAIGESLRSNPQGDPTRVGGGAGVPSPVPQKKGRSFLGRARRKKGSAGE